MDNLKISYKLQLIFHILKSFTQLINYICGMVYFADVNSSVIE